MNLRPHHLQSSMTINISRCVFFSSSSSINNVFSTFFPFFIIFNFVINFSFIQNETSISRFFLLSFPMIIIIIIFIIFFILRINPNANKYLIKMENKSTNIYTINIHIYEIYKIINLKTPSIKL